MVLFSAMKNGSFIFRPNVKNFNRPINSYIYQRQFSQITWVSLKEKKKTKKKNIFVIIMFIVFEFLQFCIITHFLKNDILKQAIAWNTIFLKIYFFPERWKSQVEGETSDVILYRTELIRMVRLRTESRQVTNLFRMKDIFAPTLLDYHPPL